MRAQILLPRQSHAGCRPPPTPLLSLFICLPLSRLCSVVTEQKPESASRYGKVTVRGDFEARVPGLDEV